MKKFLPILILLVLSVTSIAASPDEEQPFFRFQLAPMEPLFREPMADPYSSCSRISRMEMSDEESIPHTVLISNGEEYVEVPFSSVDLENHNIFWQLKSAANIGLMRVTVGPVQVEGYLQGGLSSTFEGFSGLDTLGFGGIYGAGVSLRLFDVLALQGGLHHYSGHWGDETLITLAEEGVDLATTKLEEYTRGNSWIAGLSLDLFEHLRLYGLAELPMDHAWVRPGIHVPDYVFKPGSDDQSQFDYITGQEGLTDLEAPDSSYKAWRLQCGLEFRLPLWEMGSLFLAGDLQFHQDGQTLHQVGGYDPDNPWETEFTVGGGFEFNRTLLGRKVRLEAYYHDGRFPELNYFYQRSRFVSMGFAING